MKIIDSFLNSITMYKLILYYLIGLLVIAFGLSFLHVLPFSPLSLLFSTVYVLIVSYITNKIFSKLFHAPTNLESVYISALIFALIITPGQWIFLSWAAILGIASKYVLAFNKKHLFNPVAFGVFAAGFGLSQFASWWVGTGTMLLPVLVGGLLIVRKIRREDMVFTFFVVGLLTIMGFAMFNGTNLMAQVQNVFLETPILFFAFVMFTEPLTTPPTKNLQILYGAIVGFLFCPQVHLGTLYATPELALLLGNLYSYSVSSKERLLLTLEKKVRVAPDIYNLVFSLSQKFLFTPGQYMEWTLPHRSPDSRGNRRYFTIASSPTENKMIVGVRFNPKGSSFKNTLSTLSSKEKIVAAQLSGDFTMPKDVSKKLVFIAGGIGVTPFRSMVKYVMDRGEKRDIVLLYTAKSVKDFAYKEIFDDATNRGIIRTVYTITDKSCVPQNWTGETGRIDANLIKRKVLDFKERYFYLSGPNALVEAYETLLKKMGVRSNRIKKDYFPGFA